jgi:hypothetical protein
VEGGSKARQGVTQTDLAVFGGAGWVTIPVAFSNGDGTSTPTNAAMDSFPARAPTPGVKIVTGYFNLDAKTDLAVLGGAGWGSILVAFSNGNGTFRVTNAAVDSFPANAELRILYRCYSDPNLDPS